MIIQIYHQLNYRQNHKIFFDPVLILNKNVFSLSNDYKLSILKKGLNSPWSISFINENEIIISEKTGTIKLYDQNNGYINEINHNLNVIEDLNSQGGLLEILYSVSYTHLTLPTTTIV